MSTHAAGNVRRPIALALSIALWLAACAWAIATFSVSNDHFGRISPGRQIARYGELPFRDFFDPGYFLTELSSAALQRLLGDNLLGEMLLTSAFIASGTVIVFVLAQRVSHSLTVGLAAAVLALFAVPRPYDYDKVLFYPLGLLLACRYAEQPTTRRALALATALVGGALFRYDTGVYIALVAATAMIAVHGRAFSALARSGARLGMVLTCVSVPVLAAVHWQVGIGNAADQAWSYGSRERARTAIGTWPLLTLGSEVFGVVPAPPRPRISVRWAASVDDRSRVAEASRLGLVDGRPPAVPESRTWSYSITDSSRDGLRRIVAHPAVEDTDGIERGSLVLVDPDPWWTRVVRDVPMLRFRVFPEFWQPANASALLYYTCWLLPFATAASLVARGSTIDFTRPCIWSTVALCLVTNALVLRDPVEARIGGVAGAPAVLAAWLGTRAWRAAARPKPGAMSAARRDPGTTNGVRPNARRLVRVILVLALLLIVWSLSVAGDWRRRVIPQLSSPEVLVANVEVAMASPPPDSQLPTGAMGGLVRYVRMCTGPEDRVFASWFVPELYFFAQRPFAGGMTVVFGDHWSEPRFQRRSVALLRAQRPPIVVIEQRSREAFEATYPQIARFFREQYASAGIRDFGNPEAAGGYDVLVPRTRTPTALDPATTLPCFR